MLRIAEQVGRKLIRLHDEAASIELKRITVGMTYQVSRAAAPPGPGDRVAARAAVRLLGAVVLVTAINLVAGLGSISSGSGIRP